MKRKTLTLLMAALALTACTDLPAVPQPTATVTEPQTSPSPTSVLTDETISNTIAHILELPDAEALLTGDDAMTEIRTMVLPSPGHNTSQCPPVTETQPDAAGFGAVHDDGGDPADENEATTEALAAVSFGTDDEAVAFIQQLQDFVQACSTVDYEIEPLTHHTDEAFEIQVEAPDDTTSSLVILRNENAVLLASSTPATDVALTLTLADQLDEMLR